MTDKDLLELKKKVDDAKTEVNKLEGQKTALLKQLKEDWKCKDIIDAKKKLSEMDNEIETLENQIEQGKQELEEKYNSDEKV
jgi:DNA-binding FrmR family transcriptional regulator